MPYIPSDAISLAEEEQLNFMAGIQSPSGQGKTFSVLNSFPNVTVLNFDKNLQAFYGSKHINQIPFHDDAFVDKIIPRGNTLDASIKPPGMRPNRRDALKIWLNKESTKFESDQTLFLDSWSRAQDGFDEQEGIEPHYNSKGEIDGYAFYGNKMDWSREILNLLKSFKCNVVVSFHEQRLSDVKGAILDGKFVPLQEGKFVNKIGSYFSEWFRSYFFPANTPISAIPAPAIEYLRAIDFIKQPDTTLSKDLGLWQTKSGIYIDCKCRVVGCPQFILADYNELVRLYKKQNIKT